MKRRLIVTVLTGSLMLAAPAAAFAKVTTVDCSRPGHGGPKVKDNDKDPGRHGGKVHDTDWRGHGGTVTDDARVSHGGPACADN